MKKRRIQYKTVGSVIRACAALLKKGWTVKKFGECIRLRPPEETEYCNCPITAIYRDTTGIPVDVLEYKSKRMRRALGLTSALSGEIIYIADTRVSAYDTFVQKRDRLHLLQALNLPFDAHWKSKVSPGLVKKFD